ncbi:MAG: dihydrodipicolinate synthase family protein [Candidatus Eremiobacteraeota bacterium]|nr:dihydrodipicolinate synthase family protein [Candidatus Eremiobacteraeota bacterium]
MLATALRLPRADGTLAPYVPSTAARHSFAPHPPPRTRVAYAAAHVVADPRAPVDPVLGGALDWDATLAYRRHLWSLGFAVADAMDTAQRGMGLTPELARELIVRVGAEARAVGGNVGFGAATDALDPAIQHPLDAIERAYADQIALIEQQSCTAIVMASRALAKTARGGDDYARVYANVLAGVSTPVILHWLGPMFDPQLAGYWGSDDLDTATETFVAIVRGNAAKIDGVKISLLDAQREVDLRRRLPDGVRVYTGDDFNYPELIAGDGAKHSDALLGIFDAIAPAARAALGALDDGDGARYDAVLAPTVTLSRHLFAAPTYAYKTGIVFLAYLNGFQEHFRMIGGAESWRSITHLATAFELADAAGLIVDQERAAARAARVFATAGIV